MRAPATFDFTPSIRQPSPSRVAVVVRLLGIGAELDERGGEQHVAGDDLRQHRLLRVGAEAGDRQRAGDERRDARAAARRGGRSRAARSTDRGSRGRGRRRSRERDAEQVRLGELAPGVAVVPVVGEVARLQVRERHAVVEDLPGEALQLLLLFGECEVHRVRFVSYRGGLPGMPSPKIAIRSRCISLVPPPNVRMCIERSIRSTRPRSTAPGESPESVAWSPHDLHQQPRGLHVELGAEHLDRSTRRPGSTRAPLCASHATFQFARRRNSSLACTRARLTCTHSWSITRRPSASFVSCAHRRTSSSMRSTHTGRAQRDPLVVELVGDEVPALVLLADEVAGRDAHVLVVGDVRVRRRRSSRSARTEKPGVSVGHDDDRDALVLLHLGVRAHREPDVVGAGREAGEDLLPVDDVLVAVAHGSGLAATRGRCRRRARCSRSRSGSRRARIFGT